MRWAENNDRQKGVRSFERRSEWPSKENYMSVALCLAMGALPHKKRYVGSRLKEDKGWAKLR